MRLGTQQVNSKGHLVIGGCDAVELAERFGTPLYVLDEEAFRARCREYRKAFQSRKPDTVIAYAGKACLNLALCRMVHEEGLALDVASIGELMTALTARFPAQDLHLHGVYKTEQELRLAIESGVGAVVIDNFDEIARLKRVLDTLPHAHPVGVLIRVAPEVEAATHPLIRTGQLDSKFGFHLVNGDAFRAVEQVLSEPRLSLKGFHCHIGSQIDDLTAFADTVRAMVEFSAQVRQRTGFTPAMLNLGGGLAVRYTPEETPPTPDALAETLTSTLRAECQRHLLPEPALMVEPGRSLIAEAGVTLYRVGAVKRVPHQRPDLPTEYLIVDGGVSDNPRPQMYGARYTAVNVHKANPHLPTRPYRILGKHCETDPIIEWADLPETQTGEVIAVLTTGAYAYSMSSNYNRYPRPAMVSVLEGQARLIVERETPESVLAHDR